MMLYKNHLLFQILIGVVALLMLSGTAFAEETEDAAPEMELRWTPDRNDKAQVRAYEELERYWQNEKVRPYIDQAYGYAILPNFFRIAAGFGFNYGSGIVIEQDTLVGRASTWQGTLGFTYGIEYHSQIILFQNAETMAEWQKGRFEFQGRGSATLVAIGGAVNPGFKPAVAIFSREKAGLMVEAAAILAKYNYKPFK
jgi:lipid-binding SYLF domain-containing protein